ncbi:hypothetical protein MMC20_007716 [Loxospora ochrophaea]|nr:hypothetical protein [Loxospora ochrophaea]
MPDIFRRLFSSQSAAKEITLVPPYGSDGPYGLIGPDGQRNPRYGPQFGLLARRDFRDHPSGSHAHSLGGRLGSYVGDSNPAFWDYGPDFNSGQVTDHDVDIVRMMQQEELSFYNHNGQEMRAPPTPDGRVGPTVWNGRKWVEIPEDVLVGGRFEEGPGEMGFGGGRGTGFGG